MPALRSSTAGLRNAERAPSILTAGMATAALQQGHSMNPNGASNLFTTAGIGFRPVQHALSRGFGTGGEQGPDPNPGARLLTPTP